MTSKGEDVHADFLVMESLFRNKGRKQNRRRNTTIEEQNGVLYSNGILTKLVSL